MNRLPQLRQDIENFPVQKPVYTVRTDYSGDLRFDLEEKKLENPWQEPTDVQKMVDEKIESELIKADDNVFFFRNKVDATESNIITSMMQELKRLLQDAMPNKEPTRTSLYKFFRGYNPRTDKDKEFIMAMYDYAMNNKQDVKTPNSKHANAFIGLVTHLRSK